MCVCKTKLSKAPLFALKDLFVPPFAQKPQNFTRKNRPKFVQSLQINIASRDFNPRQTQTSIPTKGLPRNKDRTSLPKEAFKENMFNGLRYQTEGARQGRQVHKR